MIKIFIWLDEYKVKKLEEKGLLHISKEVLAGMRRIEVPVKEDKVNEILKLFPTSKLDLSTTRSIELLPKTFKELLFEIILEQGKVDEGIIEIALSKISSDRKN
jgi:hypothetical protein